MNKAHREFLASPEWAAMLVTDLAPWIDEVADLGDDVLELGPGPGLTTDLLRCRASHVTAVELDIDLASALALRLAGTNVTVVRAHAAETGLPSNRFSAVASFGMLHHVPSAAEQDRVLREARRVLQPGRQFYGTDSRDLDVIRAFHEGDDFLPLGDRAISTRLLGAGFVEPEVELLGHEIRFRAMKPTDADELHTRSTLRSRPEAPT
jgi:SAM-dependent methyltransferase